jgi:hypothetical protein
MANYGPTSVVIKYDVTDGGALTDITAYVQTINGIDIEEIMEETRSLGDAWEEFLPVGVAKMAPIELSGLYDDASSPAPNVVFGGRIPAGPAQVTRSFQVTWGSTKTTSVETHLVKFTRTADKSALTRYSVTLQPTGTVTEA